MWSFGYVYVRAADEVKTPEQIAAEEEQKKKEDDLKNEQKKIEKKAGKIEEQKASLEGQLGSVKQTLGATKRTIADVEQDITSKESDIKRHDAQIAMLQDQIILFQKTLSKTIREAYYTQNNQAVSSMMETDDSYHFLEKTDDLSEMRTRIAECVNQVANAKNTQEQKKSELESLINEKEELLTEHKEKESSLVAQSNEVQTQIVKADATLTELNEKLSAVESKLSSLLGKSFSTDDIVEAAKFASKETGVRKDFILGMLVVETNLGSFTGGCTYKNSNMNVTRQNIFKDICEKLDYDYKKQKVSCPPANYKGTGGAMGVAQFMSDTWKGYESKIASKTGNNPPDPWSLTDGVMAMALKLANDGATKKNGEWTAASRYLGTCSTKNTKFYCEDVLYWADNYEKKL